MGRKSGFNIGGTKGLGIPKLNLNKAISLDTNFGFKIPKSGRGGWGRSRRRRNPTRIIWER